MFYAFSLVSSKGSYLVATALSLPRCSLKFCSVYKRRILTSYLPCRTRKCCSYERRFRRATPSLVTVLYMTRGAVKGTLVAMCHKCGLPENIPTLHRILLPNPPPPPRRFSIARQQIDQIKVLKQRAVQLNKEGRRAEAMACLKRAKSIEADLLREAHGKGFVVGDEVGELGRRPSLLRQGSSGRSGKGGERAANADVAHAPPRRKESR